MDKYERDVTRLILWTAGICASIVTSFVAIAVYVLLSTGGLIK